MIPLLYHTYLSIFLTLVSSAEAAVMDSLLAAALAAVLPDENPTLWVSRSKNASIIPSCGTQTHVSHGLLRFSSRYKICIEIHMVVLQLLNSQNPTTMPKELHQPQWPAPHHYSAMKHCVKVVLLLYITIYTSLVEGFLSAQGTSSICRVPALSPTANISCFATIIIETPWITIIQGDKIPEVNLANPTLCQKTGRPFLQVTAPNILQCYYPQNFYPQNRNAAHTKHDIGHMM